MPRPHWTLVDDPLARPDTESLHVLRALDDLAEVHIRRPGTAFPDAPQDGVLFVGGLPLDTWDTIPDHAVWWWTAPIPHTGQALEWARRVPRVYAARPAWRDLLVAEGIDAQWLPLAADEGLYWPWEVSTTVDVGYLGPRDEREIERRISVVRSVTTDVYLGRQYLEERARTYGHVRVVFHHPPAEVADATPCEVLACQAFLLTSAEAAVGFDPPLRDGVHLATYASDEELADKLRYYLDRPEQRERIAKQGYEEVLARHTYAHRLAVILGEEPENASTPVVTSLTREVPAAEQPPAAISTPVEDSGEREERPQLSLCMIVRDSARTLDACLASIAPYVDELVIVDTGSRDETPRIVERHGGRLFHFPWCDDFSAARNVSLNHARGEWLFWMDSDDTIRPEVGEQLRRLLDPEPPPHILGFVMQVHCPVGEPEGDYTSVDHIKLFRNRPDLRFEGRIHEQILGAIRQAGGEVAWTDLYVVHSGSDQSPEGQARKLERDLRLLHLEEQERPEHTFTLFNLGMTYSEKGEHARAAGYLRRSLAAAAPRESHVRKAYALLVGALQQQDLLPEALAAAEEGLGHYPDDPELHFRRGLLLHHLDRLEESLAAYQRVLAPREERYFSSVDVGVLGYKARQNLASVLADLGRWQEAAELWQQVVAERPGNREAWRQLLFAYEQLGDQPAVTAVEARLLLQPPLRGLVAAQRARRLLAAGELDAARRELELALCTYPELEPLQALCQLEFEQGDAERAAEALDRLLEQMPQDAAAQHNRGAVALRLDAPHEAVAFFRKSLDLRPASAATQLHLGAAQQRLARWDLARQAWEEARRLDPDGPAGQEAAERLRELSLPSVAGAASTLVQDKGSQESDKDSDTEAPPERP